MTAAGAVIVRYSNGDVKVTYPRHHRISQQLGCGEDVLGTHLSIEGEQDDVAVVAYFYQEANTSHCTFLDGTQVFRFPSGQSEKHRSGGGKEILYVDGTIRTVAANGRTRTTFPDGTVEDEDRDERDYDA